MTCPTPSFGLSAEDMDLIETALQQSQEILSQRFLSHTHRACIEEGASGEKARRLDERLGRIQDLRVRLNGGKAAGSPASGLS